jgi:hypothetical protein
VFTRLVQGEQRQQLGRAHARARGREMNLPDEHSGAVENGSVRLELRDIATGVFAAAWQLTCEGVRAPFWTGRAGLDSLGCGCA